MHTPDSLAVDVSNHTWTLDLQSGALVSILQGFQVSRILSALEVTDNHCETIRPLLHVGWEEIR